jgi:hypothetical protein
VRRLRRFGAFAVDFVFGDDWRMAVGVALGLGLTAVVVHVAHRPGWWLLPVSVLAVLALSLRAASAQPPAGDG